MSGTRFNPGDRPTGAPTSGPTNVPTNGHTGDPLLTEVSRRVILVGRTGLDQQLRKARGVEIVRAADSLSAVGELRDAPEGLEEAQPIVIVGPLPLNPDPAGTAHEFVDALRLVDGRVRVLGTPSAAAADAYDGLIYPDATTQRMLELIDQPRPQHVAKHPDTNGHAGDESAKARAPESDTGPIPGPTTRPEPMAEPEPVDAPVIEAPVLVRDEELRSSFGPSIQHESGGPGGWGASVDLDDDATLITEMLRGHEVRDAAIKIIGHRLGATVAWSDREPEPGSEQRPWVPVALGANPVGWLGVPSGGVSKSRLARQAGWLAAWLRLQQQQRDLRHAAFTDHLTGAWNRRYFERYLSATFDRARLSRLPVTVMVFDIDHFKVYNDRFGHAAGDEILREAVALLRSCIRPTDRVCRIGGDEFAVIFYEPGGPRGKGSAGGGGGGPMSVYTIAKRFQRQICEHRFPKLGDELEGTLTISGGLATFPWDGTTPEALLRRADELALESKRAGKNAITLGEGAERVCHLQFPNDDGSEGEPAPEGDTSHGADPTPEID